jgi:hypothetical protein
MVPACTAAAAMVDAGPMRVTTSLFVAALIRRAANAGASAVVQRHGSDEAGALFISVDRLDGTVDLYSPAPNSAFMDEQPLPSDRLFTRVAAAAPDAVVADRLAREARFDPDLWVVTIEDRQGRAFVELAPA